MKARKIISRISELFIKSGIKDGVTLYLKKRVEEACN